MNNWRDTSDYLESMGNRSTDRLKEIAARLSEDLVVQVDEHHDNEAAETARKIRDINQVLNHRNENLPHDTLYRLVAAYKTQSELLPTFMREGHDLNSLVDAMCHTEFVLRDNSLAEAVEEIGSQ